MKLARRKLNLLARSVLQSSGVLALLVTGLPAGHANQLPDAVRQQVCRQLAQPVPDGVNADRLSPQRDGSDLPALRKQPLAGLQHQALRFGFAHDLATLDIDQDGQDDLAYGVDVVGQVWRFRLQGSSLIRLDQLPAVRRLAELGGTVHNHQDKLQRVFQMPPALAVQRDPVTGHSVVTLAIASGWVAMPHATVHDDGLFIIRDAAPFAGADFTTPLRPDASQAGVTTWQDAAASPALSAPMLMVQWLSAPGEKVLVAPLIIQGVAYFVTYTPGSPSAPCPPLAGEARLYSVDLRTAQPGLPAGRAAPVVADVFRHPASFPAEAAWLGVHWALPSTDGDIVLDLAGQQVLGAAMERRIETISWQRLPSFTTP